MLVNVKENCLMVRIVRMNVILVVALFAGLVLGLGCSNKNKTAQAKNQPKSSTPAGGGGGGGGAAAALTGKTWTQTMVDGAEIPAPADAQRKASLTFSTDGRVTAYTGVNRITGGYTVDGQNLKFSNLGMTRGGVGSEAQTAAEAKIAEALRATTAHRITDGKLELLAGDRVVARYE